VVGVNADQYKHSDNIISTPGCGGLEYACILI